tara:strand:+ start:527 stop:1270 length:744 start_codon:yes stop_codon:yes gene_type:complete
MINLHKYRYNKHSLSGEDGVIEKILEISFENKKINTCEFGAGDIEKNSNTLNLIKKDQVNFSVFIEKDKVLYEKILNVKKRYSQIIPLNLNVEFENNSENTIDKILKRNNISNNIDIMSIDIDSYDLDVFRSIKIYHPKLLIIESGRQKYGVLSEHSKNKNQNSFSSIYNVIKHKYYLIFYNGNLFFLNKNDFSKTHIANNYYLNDEYQYLLHCIYHNYSKRGFFKRLLIDLLSKNKFLMKLIINYK